MKPIRAYFVTSLLIAGVAVVALGDADESWDASDVERISIDGVSGDVIIRPANGGNARVELDARVRPADVFEPVVERHGRELDIEEEFHGNSNGPVRWTIYLPNDGDVTSIRISNASGNLECTDVAVAIRYKTASGDVTLSNVSLDADSKFSTASGDFRVQAMTIGGDSRFSTASGNLELDDVTIKDDSEFSTASGDIMIDNCRSGDDVTFSSASGDVDISDTELDGETHFSSASGDVDLHFKTLPDTDFTASSASGDVTLNVVDFGDDFTLVMEKREDRGRISCPFDYTDEETFRKHGEDYVRKIVERGTGNPVIELRTASGRIRVKN